MTTTTKPKTLTFAAHNWTGGNVTVTMHDDYHFEVYDYNFVLKPQGEYMALVDLLAGCQIAIVFEDHGEWIAADVQGRDFNRTGKTAIEAAARLIANLY